MIYGDVTHVFASAQRGISEIRRSYLSIIMHVADEWTCAVWFVR